MSRLSRLYAAALSDFYGVVEVWSLTDPPRCSPDPGRIECRGARASRARYALWALTKGAASQKNRRVVVLHTHLAPVSLPLVCRGASLVHVLVGIEAWRPLARLESTALERASRMVAISHHTRARFIHSNPRFAEKTIAVCHPGLPDRRLAEHAGQRELFALMVGRMAREEKYKGHEHLFRAWARIEKDLPEARLVVVGEGDDRRRLEAFVGALGLRQSIRFTGRVADVELSRLYEECAVFVMPSRGEGFGFVYLEAMRAGKPCIGGQDAAAEIIEHGKTGLVVPCDDPPVLGEALKRYLVDAGLRNEHGKRGRERFLRHFTEAHFRDRLRAILD